MKLSGLVGALAALLLSPMGVALEFDDAFSGTTMRLDLFHTGTAQFEHLSLDRVRIEGPWPGSRIHLLDPTNLGKYRFEIVDLDPVVVVDVIEFRRRRAVQIADRVGVQLQRTRGNHAGNRPFDCGGYRLREQALAVKIGGLHIGQVTEMSLKDASDWAGTIMDGRYEVIRNVGAGGFGCVFEVRHLVEAGLTPTLSPIPRYIGRM